MPASSAEIASERKAVLIAGLDQAIAKGYSQWQRELPDEPIQATIRRVIVAYLLREGVLK